VIKRNSQPGAGNYRGYKITYRRGRGEPYKIVDDRGECHGFRSVQDARDYIDEVARLNKILYRPFPMQPTDNPGGLQLRSARTRQGVLFETGLPVTFRAMRNTAPSVYMGSRFGQDIEPAGTFMLLDDAENWKDPAAQLEGWVFFEQTFFSPLVIAMVADDSSNTPSYGPLGWKRRLSEAFGGRTGVELTQAILAAGHDGIVTVGPARNDVREIVDLTAMPRSAAMRAKKNPQENSQPGTGSYRGFEIVHERRRVFHGGRRVWREVVAVYLPSAPAYPRMGSFNSPAEAQAFVDWYLDQPQENPLDPEAWASERQPCALTRLTLPLPDDREGVHFALSWGLAARYALFKSSMSQSVGIVLTYDLSGLELEPDHDATIEKAYGDYMVREVNYYIDEFDILEDPENPDYERLARLMEGEAEHHEPEPDGDLSIEKQLIENAKSNIFVLLADKLMDPMTQDEALDAIQNADIPKEWWAEVIGQMRTFSVVGDERLLRVQALKPVEPDISLDDDPYADTRHSADLPCPEVLTVEDLDYLADALEQMSVTLWESPRADQVAEPYFHGTDLIRAQVILEAAPAAAELRNPWDPCTQP